MGFHVVYWHWLVLGAALAAAEIFLPSFFSLGAGLGAMFVGALLWLFPALPVSAQLLTWAGGTVALTSLWFKYLRPQLRPGLMPRHDDVPPQTFLGQVAMVIAAPKQGQPGRLRFAIPVAGAEEWPCVSDDALAEGDRVMVTAVAADHLKVMRK